MQQIPPGLSIPGFYSPIFTKSAEEPKFRVHLRTPWVRWTLAFVGGFIIAGTIFALPRINAPLPFNSSDIPSEERQHIYETVRQTMASQTTEWQMPPNPQFTEKVSAAAW